MAISLSNFVERLNPEKTILFFGAGSSLPSGAPSVAALKERFCERFKQTDNGFALAELSQIIETKNNNRRQIISEMREQFKRCRATGGILSLPMYDWKALYTTNYDQLIEETYKREGRDIKVYTSNFDFTADGKPLDQKLYKIHGSIEKDTSDDGGASRLILTTLDYNLSQEYRQFMYRRLESDLSEGHMVIIGYSLSDPDIKDVVRRSIDLKKQAFGTERITILSYTPDPDRASLFEAEGLDVVFAGIDEFFFELAKFADKKIDLELLSEIFELPATVRPSAIDVGHATSFLPPSFSRMFNGGSASYSDIEKGLTFSREIVNQLEAYFLGNDANEKFIAIILGTSGVGKTSACRQVLMKLRKSDFFLLGTQGRFSAILRRLD